MKKISIAIAATCLICASSSFAAGPVHLKCGSGESPSQWNFTVDFEAKTISRGDLPKYDQIYDENFSADERFYYAEGKKPDSTGRWAPVKIWVDRTQRTVREQTYESFVSKWYDSRYDGCAPYAPEKKTQF